MSRCLFFLLYAELNGCEVLGYLDFDVFFALQCSLLFQKKVNLLVDLLPNSLKAF